MEVVTSCPTCGALVHLKMLEDHQEWHQRIADVAIESTKRVEALEQGVRHLIGDKNG